MNENELIDVLTEILYDCEKFSSQDILSFREAGLLTNNNGLVLKLEDGSEFQITVVKSK